MTRTSNHGRLGLASSLCLAALLAGCGGSDGTAEGTGGSGQTGGTTGTGGTKATGGTTGTGGATGTGGGSATGGATGTGGATATGGAGGHAGAIGTGGAGGHAGATGTGGAGGHAGATGGTAGSNATGGTGGAVTTGLPGDVTAAAGTPLVAAHSLTRALFAAYNGNLFQVRRASDSKTQDIGVASMGGQVDLTTLNSFCTGTTCSVSKLYDQAGNGNDMSQATAANQPAVQFWTTLDGTTKLPMAVSTNRQWLRNRLQTKKIPTGSKPQTEYMVVHAAFAGAIAGTNGCCYDYGNMETQITDDGPGTMSALYFGSATDWTRGAGSGPWGMMDLENGLFAGGAGIKNLNQGSASVNAQDPSIKYAGNNIAVIFGKTDGTANFTLKYGNAATGALATAWNGGLPTMPNPTPYIPLQQQGGLSLGEGGDGSNMGTGAFSEGVVIAAQTSDATDDAIQTNLTTVYGK
ncbi:MAG TPA: arabinofuranosidase catalytic domain-containing protein [Polyangia bacterium]|nr:arabinofuranosidase catalytic domain-containing protein [Polyangia bacterium]